MNGPYCEYCGVQLTDETWPTFDYQGKRVTINILRGKVNPLHPEEPVSVYTQDMVCRSCSIAVVKDYDTLQK